MKLENKIIFALNHTTDLYQEHRALQYAWRYNGLSGEVYSGDGVYNGQEEQCYVVNWTQEKMRNLSGYLHANITKRVLCLYHR